MQQLGTLVPTATPVPTMPTMPSALIAPAALRASELATGMERRFVYTRGDPVRVTDETGRELARGLSAYDAADAARIAGHRSAEIEAILGWRGRDELIHRDDLVLASDHGAGDGK